MSAPFSNCRFRECDLPGQCRGEGKCHHPAVSAADRSEPRKVPDAVVCAIQAYGDARADNGDSAAAILHVINLIRAELAAPVADSAMAKEPVWCQSCGDGITAHGPGICGNCFAIKNSGSALALLRRIPTTPDQMIEFIGNQYMSMAPCEDDGSYAGHPSEVEYTLSVHDLLSAFQWADLDKDSIDAALAASEPKKEPT